MSGTTADALAQARLRGVGHRGLLALYADGVELIQIDGDNPPGSPRVRRGTEVFKGMFEHCAAAGVKATVENAVAGEDRAAGVT